MKNIDNKMNEMSNIIVNESNINQINDNSNSKKKGRRKGSLSPPGYESDEDLRKIAMTEHDFLFDLAEKRKVILIEKLKEYKENKINDEMNKNKNLENTGNKNNENKKSNVENILGENFQDAINFLNRIIVHFSLRKKIVSQKRLNLNLSTTEHLTNDSININTDDNSEINYNTINHFHVQRKKFPSKFKKFNEFNKPLKNKISRNRTQDKYISTKPNDSFKNINDDLTKLIKKIKK